MYRTSVMILLKPIVQMDEKQPNAFDEEMKGWIFIYLLFIYFMDMH
jgi:hypothetical protein